MKTRGVPDSYNVVYGYVLISDTNCLNSSEFKKILFRLDRLNRLVTPLFANRLLLNMRKIKNQETSVVVSSLMFSPITDLSERDSQMRV
jgi:hypothetical protein